MASDRFSTVESLEPFDILTEFTSFPTLLLQKQEGGQGLEIDIWVARDGTQRKATGTNPGEERHLSLQKSVKRKELR